MWKNKFVKGKLAVCFVLALGVLVNGNVVMAATAEKGDSIMSTSTYSLTADKEKSKKGESITKTSTTGTDAKIVFKTKIPSNMKILVHIRTASDEVVSPTREYTNVGADSIRYIPYNSGKGKKGTKYYPSFLVDMGSASNSLYISYKFTA